MMTMAFRWKGQKYGMSYEINDDNRNHIDIMRKNCSRLSKKLWMSLSITEQKSLILWEYRPEKSQ